MPTQLGARFLKPLHAPPAPRTMATDARVARSRKRLEASKDSVQPSIGIADAYRRSLLKLIREMDKSIKYWVGARFKQTEPERAEINPELAMDATAAEELQKAIRELRTRWLGRFDKLAEELAAHFAKSVAERSDADLKRILKKGGIAIDFQMTPAMKESVSAIVQENVSLIKSIPEKYLGSVEGSVMRSVVAGRDLHSLYEDLTKNFGVTKRRAELITRDQSNKATSALLKVRYTEAGIVEAIWRHSRAGRDKRPSHVANSGKKFNVATGWYDPDAKEWIRPGQLVNCRCGMVPILP
jgi:SPP1 gp7 family putative phage head morphogenesis protein